MEAASLGANSEGAPPLVVCTRFGLQVKDEGWLLHRLALLAAVTAPSLLTQRDKNFRWVLMVDDGLPRSVRKELEAITEPFGERAFLFQRPFHMPEHLAEMAEAEGLSGGSEYLLTGRIDDDDAWSTSMVGATREHVASWLGQPGRAPGLSLTFQDGLEWVMYEILDVEQLVREDARIVHSEGMRRYRQPFIGMSVFVCSPLSAGMTAMAGAHSKVADMLSRRMGFAVQVVPTELPMWLYCRHKQAGSGIRKARGESIALDLQELSTQFGIDASRVQRYLQGADEYQYALIKEPIGKKRKLLVELLDVSERLSTPDTSTDERRRLKSRKTELTARLAELESSVVGDPDDLLPT